MAAVRGIGPGCSLDSGTSGYDGHWELAIASNFADPHPLPLLMLPDGSCANHAGAAAQPDRAAATPAHCRSLACKQACPRLSWGQRESSGMGRWVAAAGPSGQGINPLASGNWELPGCFPILGCGRGTPLPLPPKQVTVARARAWLLDLGFALGPTGSIYVVLVRGEGASQCFSCAEGMGRRRSTAL